ncbi:MAG TPA: GntG family PLP-dependent aldolase [Abditibacteriaceae bacterium]|nr:GntG family PLP-dependent aldolase [Abditibacteriaceae bacterium]
MTALDAESLIDLRSDVMTPPTAEMWEAMRRAQCGGVRFGEDECVRELEALGAELLGKEAALFVPTCSMANLLALMTLGERGTQVILEAASHIAWSEEYGFAHICGLFPRLLPGTDGVLQPAAIEEALLIPRFSHLPRTSLVCLENSHNNAGGIAVTPAQTAAVAMVARQHGVAVHLDGARLFNAAVALGVLPRQLAAAVDSVAVSLNKGLCAPFGALLCGSSQVINEARINARRIGAASIHKAGIFAAAGTIALTSMIDRLADDNRRAAALARRLKALPDLYIDLETVQTNIVKATVMREGLTSREFVARLAQGSVLALERSAQDVRFVTHRLIGDAAIERAAQAVARALK